MFTLCTVLYRVDSHLFTGLILPKIIHSLSFYFSFQPFFIVITSRIHRWLMLQISIVFVMLFFNSVCMCDVGEESITGFTLFYQFDFYEIYTFCAYRILGFILFFSLFGCEMCLWVSIWMWVNNIYIHMKNSSTTFYFLCLLARFVCLYSIIHK